ncbi:MAG: hypothetical protein OXT65_07965, partial [Alphaproteobacteria bacterium]|nr:hypothetical protein [Alphaproteobacteria bacterium]
MSDDWGDEVILFTPGPGFDIRAAADEFVEAMEEYGLPLLIRLPHVSIEFEPGCTQEEIIEGYMN